jgi:hypothetical protein
MLKNRTMKTVDIILRRWGGRIRGGIEKVILSMYIVCMSCLQQTQ